MQTTIRNNGQIMPLLMNFTPATPIEEETEMYNVIYDEKNQIVYDMRMIGTRSLRVSVTHKNGQSPTDRKNEIDDSKNVK